MITTVISETKPLKEVYSSLIPDGYGSWYDLKTLIVMFEDSLVCYDNSLVCNEDSIVCYDNSLVCNEDSIICHDNSLVCNEDSLDCHYDSIVLNKYNQYTNYS